AARSVGPPRRSAKRERAGSVRGDIVDAVARYGRVKLVQEGQHLLLVSEDRPLLVEIERHKHIAPCLIGRHLSGGLLVDPAQRGRIKQALLQFGYPAEDLAGYVSGAPLEIALRATTLDGRSFMLRDYQQEAVAVFHADGTSRGGSGVIVLPCGAGKTVVGLGVLARLQCHTLILTPSIVAARQWIHEILDKTSVPAEAIGEYSGERKEVRPITVTTYQVLTYRPSRSADFPHFALFNDHDWGLIVYDEVHLLPAPVLGSRHRKREKPR